MTFDVEVENRALLLALDTLGDAAEPFIERASEVTANRIVLEARSRVRRATGQTQAGIVTEASKFGSGLVVVSGNRRMPNLPHWIERGTKHQPPRPYFEPAVELQRQAHFERISDAIREAIELKGLGE